VTIPNSVTSIGEYAFYNCSSLDSLSIGNGVTSIGDRAFEGCNTLTYLAINSPKIVSESYMLEKLGPCRGAENMIIGDDVKYIVGGAFRNCGNLRSLTIGNGITSISKGAFEYCYIEDLTIGNSVTIIEESAFNGNGINHVIIPNSVRYIGEHAFYGDCSRVTLKPDTPPGLGGFNVFRCHQGPTIYVSCKAYESYIKNDKWKMYKDDIESIPINKVEGRAKDKNTGKVSVSSTSSFDCQAQIKFTAIPKKDINLYNGAMV
jgi:hypothetical protein